MSSPFLIHIFADEVIIERLNDFYLNEITVGILALGSVEVNLAVNVGSVCLGSAEVNLRYGIVAVGDDGNLGANLGCVKLLGDGELSLHKNIVSVLLKLFINLVGEQSSLGILLGRVGECAESVECSGDIK